VAAVHPAQHLVVRRFHAIFDADVMVARQGLQVVQHFVRHRVRAGADDEPHHPRAGKGFRVTLFQDSERSVGARIRLEVSQVFLPGILGGKESLAFGNLRGDGRRCPAIIGVEAPVVAEGAASRPLRPIPVGAGETTVDGEFLHPFPEKRPEKRGVILVSFLCHNVRLSGGKDTGSAAKLQAPRQR